MMIAGQVKSRMQSAPVDSSVVAPSARRYRCPGCGAELLFQPSHNSLRCEYCGRQEHIPATFEAVNERSFEEYLTPRAAQLQMLAARACEVQCESCGATTVFTPPEVAGKCDFCGAKIVAQPKSSDPLVAPEGVLPFHFTPAQSSEAVRRWMQSLWFAPSALKKFANQESISGVYLPYWTYDAYAVSHYTGRRGEHYFETEHYTTTDHNGNRVTRTRQVRKTRWYDASGKVSRRFDDILIPASAALPAPRLRALEPWDLSQLVAYEPAYLLGFKAQRYQVDLRGGFEQAQQRAAPVISDDIRRDIGGDEQQIDQQRTHYSAVTFKHILLPVYVSAYRYRHQIYQVLINGRTGEVQGDRPYSVWKILLLILFVLFVIGAAVLMSGDSNFSFNVSVK